MNKLADKPAEGTDKPVLHPRYLQQCRGFALLTIMGAIDDDYLPNLDAHGVIAEYVGAYRAQGMRPKRAERLFALIEDGREFQVIPGGGETTDTLRAVLRLVGAE